MTNMSPRRWPANTWPNFAVAAATLGASAPLSQNAPVRPPQAKSGHAAPVSAEANALDQGLLRVKQDLLLALDRQQLRAEVDVAFNEVEVDYSHMASAAIAAAHAPAELFAGLDRTAFAGLGDFSYTLDADEG